MKILLLAITNSLLMAIGQMLWKKGVMSVTINTLGDLARAVISPCILIGLLVYGITMFLWLYLLNKAEISYVYPLQSVVFVFVLIGSAILFKESVRLNRWFGVAFICVGVGLVSIK